MNKLLSLLAGVAMVGFVGTAQAAEPVQLTSLQMDSVTAGNAPDTNVTIINTTITNTVTQVCAAVVACQNSSNVSNVVGAAGDVTVTQNATNTIRNSFNINKKKKRHS